jgi:NADH dehydrogenase (ubiquinone) 1 beta subcomplex subunit 8
MLSQRLVRAAALRKSTAAARRLPAIQRRTYLPSSFSDKKVYEEKYPDAPKLSAAEDPEMVRGMAIGSSWDLPQRR